MKPWNLGISCEKRQYEYFLKKSGFENIQYAKISLRGKIFALKIFIKNVLVLKFKRFLYRKALKNTKFMINKLSKSIIWHVSILLNSFKIKRYAAYAGKI